MVNWDDKVSIREAYLGMFEYLRRRYERGSSAEIGSMLGSLSLLQDGESVDPAAMSDFLASMDAVRRAEEEGGYDEANFKLS